jgi:hypothetical protein
MNINQQIPKNDKNLNYINNSEKNYVKKMITIKIKIVKRSDR